MSKILSKIGKKKRIARKKNRWKKSKIGSALTTKNTPHDKKPRITLPLYPIHFWHYTQYSQHYNNAQQLSHIIHNLTSLSCTLLAFFKFITHTTNILHDKNTEKKYLVYTPIWSTVCKYSLLKNGFLELKSKFISKWPLEIDYTVNKFYIWSIRNTNLKCLPTTHAYIMMHINLCMAFVNAMK